MRQFTQQERLNATGKLFDRCYADVPPECVPPRIPRIQMMLNNQSPVGTPVAIDVQCEVNEAVTLFKEGLAEGSLSGRQDLSARVAAWLERNQ